MLLEALISNNKLKIEMGHFLKHEAVYDLTKAYPMVTLQADLIWPDSPFKTCHA
jgi:hypothetical protein